MRPRGRPRDGTACEQRDRSSDPDDPVVSIALSVRVGRRSCVGNGGKIVPYLRGYDSNVVAQAARRVREVMHVFLDAPQGRVVYSLTIPIFIDGRLTGDL